MKTRQHGVALHEVLFGLVILSMVYALSTSLGDVTSNSDLIAQQAAYQINQASTLQAEMVGASNQSLFDIQQIAVNAWQAGVSFNACAQNPLCANMYAADGYPISNTVGGYYEMSERNLSQRIRPDLLWPQSVQPPDISGFCTPIWIQNGQPAQANLPAPSNPTNPYIAYTGASGDTTIDAQAQAPSNIDCAMLMQPDDMALPFRMYTPYVASLDSIWSVPYFTQDPTTRLISTAASPGYPGPGYVNTNQEASNAGYVTLLDPTTGAPNYVDGPGAYFGFQNIEGDASIPASIWRNPSSGGDISTTIDNAGANTLGTPTNPFSIEDSPQDWTSISLLNSSNQLATDGAMSIDGTSAYTEAIPLGYFDPMIWTSASKLLNGIVFKTWDDPVTASYYTCPSGYTGGPITLEIETVHAIVSDASASNGMQQIDTQQIVGSSGECVSTSGGSALNPLLASSFNGIPVNQSLAVTDQQLYGTTPTTTCTSSSCSVTYQSLSVDASGATNGSGASNTYSSSANTFAPASHTIQGIAQAEMANSEVTFTPTAPPPTASCAIGTATCGALTLTPAS